MAIVPLCCNIAWEMVYVFVHPSTNRLEHVVFILGLCLNIAIIHAAIRFSPREWGHAPLVERNLPWIFAVGILACLSGHVALAAEIGPRLAYSWGAVVCQLLLSIGGLGQLLARESTRGGSYISWSGPTNSSMIIFANYAAFLRLGRALGSSCTVVFATIRYIYWPEAFAWLCSPLIIWSLTVFILTDTTYGVCFYVIHQREIKTKAGRAVQKGC